MLRSELTKGIKIKHNRNTTFIKHTNNLDRDKAFFLLKNTISVDFAISATDYSFISVAPVKQLLQNFYLLCLEIMRECPVNFSSVNCPNAFEPLQLKALYLKTFTIDYLKVNVTFFRETSSFKSKSLHLDQILLFQIYCSGV